MRCSNRWRHMRINQLRRREFITLLGGAAVGWPLGANAQLPDRVRRIGVLMGYAESDSLGQARIALFREELQKLEWAENRNIRIDYRWAAPADAKAIRRVEDRTPRAVSLGNIPPI
jgi:putative tryptophan/tyrosine transport system substrate-binding protein